MKSKKKFLILVIAISTLIGGTQVYAATVLGTNITGLISSGIISIRNYFLGTTVPNEINNLNSKYTNSVDDYAKQKANEALTDLQNHTNKEMTRANNELNTYLNDIKSEINTEYNSEIAKSKEAITSSVNQNINNIKVNLSKELEKQIQEQMQQKVKELEGK